MSTERIVERALAAWAGEITTVRFDGPTVRARGRALRRRQRLTVALAAIVMLVAGGAFAARTFQGPLEPAGGSGLLSWPARGDLAGHATFTTAAVRAWDTAPLVARHGPHTATRVLYAARSDVGPLVVLTGRDRDGTARVALLRGSPFERRFSGRLLLLADRPAPRPSRTRALAFEFGDVGSEANARVVLVAEPGTTGARLTYADAAGTTDVPLTDGAGVVRAARKLNIRVEGYRDGRRTFRQQVLGFTAARPYDDGDRSSATEVCRRTLVGEECDAMGDSFEPVTGFGWTDGSSGSTITQGGNGVAEGTDAMVLTAWLLRQPLSDPHEGFSAGTRWESTLPDGTQVVAAALGLHGGPTHAVLAVRAGRYIEFYLDQPHADAHDVRQVSALIHGKERNWLVVAVDPTVTSADVALDGTHYMPVPIDHDGIVLAVREGEVTARTRLRLRAGTRVVYAGPVDSLSVLP